MKRPILPPLLFLLVSGAFAQTGNVVVDATRPTHKISPTFYGLMTEEISHSYDGGLYAERLQNRSFRDSAEFPAHWAAGDNTNIQLDRSDPNHPFLRVALLGHGASIVSNDGFWGVASMPGETLRFELIARGEDGFHGPLKIQLVGDSGKVHASANVPKLASEWHKVKFEFRTDREPTSSSNRLVISGGGAFSISYASLMGPTYRHRPNGNRSDLMTAMAGLKPSFLRLPGGNYLEGNTLVDYFPWSQTLQEPSERPGHWGPWGYHSSDGMGLLEFLNWCDDLNMSPVLAVYAGYALNGTHINPGSDLQPYVQYALDEIEFVTGTRNSKWGSIRANLGHPKPFPLTYVEIGNEDWFDRSGSYDARFAQFFAAIKAKYPKLQLIATTPVKSVVPDVVDDHFYRTAAAMARDQHHYDAIDRAGPKIFVGEWASTEGRPTPTLQAALGDAAWLIGMERNSDLVVMESYAPLFVNVNPGASQWGTNLIGYDATRITKSPSYYVQSLFATGGGDTVLPVTINISEPPSPPVIRSGKAGIGAYRTQVEYKDFSVTGPNGTLYDRPFGAQNKDWTNISGAWKFEGTSLIQTGNGRFAQTVVGATDWKNYTIKVKAKKISGSEGFLVLFNYKSPNDFAQWNVGGWNTRSAIQVRDPSDMVESGNSSDTIQNGKWYDLEVRVNGDQVTCLIDGKVATDATLTSPTVPPIHVGATRDSKTGDVILKAVNLSAQPYNIRFDLPEVDVADPIARGWILAGPPEAPNSVQKPDNIVPRKIDWKGVGNSFSQTLPANSVTVVKLRCKL
jgi:alpha-N-arabinofuranosidase